MTERAQPSEQEKPPREKVVIWDLGMRAFHWLLAASVVLGVVSGWQSKLDYVVLFGVEFSFDWGQVHVTAAYSILVLLAWRLLWGIVGSDTARLARLIPTPRALWSAIRNAKPKGMRATGHDAIGSVASLVLLGAVGLQATTGMYIEDDGLFIGPKNGELSGDMTRLFNSIHHTLGDWLPWLIGLHLAAMVFYALVKRINLVPPMLHGRESASKLLDQRSTRRSPRWLALAALLVAVALLYWWTGFKGPDYGFI